MAGNVPIRESVGAALRFSRENVRFIALVAGAGALATTAFSGLAMAAPVLGLFASLGSSLAHAAVYAALVGAFLRGPAEARGRWLADGWRVFAAMAVIGFFLFIVFFVLSIPVMIILFAGPMAPYVADLQSAAADQAAVMAVMTRFAEENPGALLAVTLFYSAVWLLLTSRLYLAAPASVDAGRILTFETWKWTQGATLRIIGARLLLLAPANILSGALGYLAGRLVGVDAFNPASAAAAATSNPAGFLFYVLVAGFISFALYSALEAGLSSYIYRGLKPAAPPPSA
jgi:hypothetical protein